MQPFVLRNAAGLSRLLRDDSEIAQGNHISRKDWGPRSPPSGSNLAFRNCSPCEPSSLDEPPAEPSNRTRYLHSEYRRHPLCSALFLDSGTVCDLPPRSSIQAYVFLAHV